VYTSPSSEADQSVASSGRISVVAGAYSSSVSYTLRVNRMPSELNVIAGSSVFVSAMLLKTARMLVAWTVAPFDVAGAVVGAAAGAAVAAGAGAAG
jgi:hypothetical protein